MSIHEILKQYWGYEEFRPLQQEIIESVLSGKDTLALLPTGGGKSICFQVPAMAKDGLCIVVSPLIALMKDQVENLKKRDIKAVAIYSGMSYREINYTLDNCIHGDIKFLYLSPERLKSDLVRERIIQMNICLLAIDEAHCISQWGYDFRPEYLQIAEIREIIKGIPVLALTATAPPEVVKDIQAQLKFPQPNVYVKSFTRKNIAYVVNNSEDKNQRMLHILSKVNGSGLVYVRNRRKTQEIAYLLTKNRISADYYHAGLPHEVRNKKQEDWIKNKTRIMVCTNAFGMGIDKPDVRIVVHYEMPESLESYYQEAGRAGRDEKKSFAVLLFNYADELEALKRLEASFPPEKEIRRVYQALCNYYQIPIGVSVDRSFDFDIIDFVKKFNLETTVAYPALRILEQTDLVSLTESFYEPSKIKFMMGQGLLYKFQVEHPHQDAFIKLLLRSYGGVFDQYITISEKLLAQREKQDEKTLRKQLIQLHQLGVVDYQPQKDQPQLTFLNHRVDAETIDFRKSLLQKRKQTATIKLHAMLDYAKNSVMCRSKKIVSYFDEFSSEDCGVCDVCLLRKKIELSNEEFIQLMNAIEEATFGKPVLLDALVKHLTNFHQEKILETVRYLLDNDKLRYNSTQQLEWKK
ncbi:ATP-dependent DNA helicase RecQ [Bacteroidetes bacterium UKL13-3]|nr:ATP-dependent DNA helicase RecQ [Bacteroidetes bacterium UKL13-3]HCP92801.1 RecQ family ATP-dependent DNA helicase [Bacteroidota bacterium]